MDSLRISLLEKMRDHERASNQKPKIAVMPFNSYLALKAEVLSRSAEFIRTDEGCWPWSCMKALIADGVECFSWNGVVVIAARSDAAGPIYFL